MVTGLDVLPEGQLSWFARKYGMKVTKRFWTWERALKLLDHLTVPGDIVETGCLRNPDSWAGDGCSTIILAEAAQRSGRKFLTIDKSQEALDTAVAEVAKADLYEPEFDHEFLRYDSVEVLEKLDRPIVFLYLDSLDAYLEGAAQHQQKELIAAWPNLVPGAIVLLDDNVRGGKTRLSEELLQMNACTVVASGYQSLWVVNRE